MKKIVLALAILALMFAEYRFIMTNIVPTFDDCGMLSLSVFGQIDQYYVAENPE